MKHTYNLFGSHRLPLGDKEINIDGIYTSTDFRLKWFIFRTVILQGVILHLLL
jgi:hypothetical protein